MRALVRGMGLLRGAVRAALPTQTPLVRCSTSLVRCPQLWRPSGLPQRPWRQGQRLDGWAGGAAAVVAGRRAVGSSCCRALQFKAEDIQAEAGVMIDGEPAGLSEDQLEQLAEALYHDSKRVVQQAVLVLLAEEEEEREEAPAPLEVSLVLCDDAHIRELNMEWRGKDAPTDVLSFEMEGDEEEGEGEEGGGPAQLPVNVLGDVVISLDTAGRQAEERGYTLLDECRVLLVHGTLHLLGFDHEEGEEEQAEMAAAEQRIMAALGWKGQGLIAAAEAGSVSDDEGGLHGSGGGCSSSSKRGSAVHTPAGRASTSASAAPSSSTARMPTRPEVQLLALDMDGTLLDSSSRVLPSSVAAIKAALAQGVMVLLATGKARPAAIAAMQAVGLAGEGLVVSTRGPGVFLQGLTTYGRGGELVAAGELPPDVVRAAFEYAALHDVPVCGFLGEHCVTIKEHPEIRELHTRYYEPLASVASSVDHILAGPPLRKLLFMTSPEAVEGRLKPHWAAALAGTAAETMQAVPNMLEVVPSGWDKWVALERLLEHLGLPSSAFMAVGDGSNDLRMVASAGVGVAMGNAVPEVKGAAAIVVASNDEGGVAEAIERYIL